MASAAARVGSAVFDGLSHEYTEMKRYSHNEGRGKGLGERLVHGAGAFVEGALGIQKQVHKKRGMDPEHVVPPGVRGGKTLASKHAKRGKGDNHTGRGYAYIPRGHG
tara:strand:- start:1 stop:321 length:321 start_codon:yes stop_codon:yes gene_type:complete